MSQPDPFRSARLDAPEPWDADETETAHELDAPAYGPRTGVWLIIGLVCMCSVIYGVLACCGL